MSVCYLKEHLHLADPDGREFDGTFWTDGIGVRILKRCPGTKMERETKGDDNSLAEFLMVLVVLIMSLIEGGSDFVG